MSTIEYSATSTKAHHTPTKRLKSNTYYWRVTPIDRKNNTGQPSEIHLLLFEVFNTITSSIFKILERQLDLTQDYSWRVRGIDAQDNYTKWSDEFSFSFGSIETYPSLIYPPHYYPPDEENFPVHRDETIAWPLFMWDTAHKWDPYPLKTVSPDYYELTVSSD